MKLVSIIIWIALTPFLCGGQTLMNWSVLIYPEQKIKNLLINPQNPNQLIAVWENGVGLSRDRGKIWHFEENKLHYSQIRSFKNQFNFLAGLDQDISERKFKKYFIYHIGSNQNYIYAEDIVENIRQRIYQDTVFTRLYFSEHSPSLLFLSSNRFLYQCYIPNLPNRLNAMEKRPAVWKNLGWSGSIEWFIPDTEQSDRIWVMSLNDPPDPLRFQLWDFRLDGMQTQQSLTVLNYKPYHSLVDTSRSFSAQRYHFDIKSGLSFFDQSNYFIFSTNYAKTFHCRLTFVTEENNIVQPLFITGNHPSAVYIFAEMIQAAKDPIYSQLEKFNYELPNIFELRQIGKEKKRKTWDTMTETEKQIFYRIYLKETFKGITDAMIHVLLNRPKFSSNKVAIYKSRYFNRKVTFVTLVPFDIDFVRQSKIRLSADGRSLYLINKGVWAFALP